MSYEIVTSSPEVTKKAINGFKAKYPFRQIMAGQSFLVDPAEKTLSHIRSYVSKEGPKYGKKFKVLEHKEPKHVYEVACVQDGLPINGVEQTPQQQQSWRE